MLSIDKKDLKIFLESKKKLIETKKFSGVGDIISGFSLILTLVLADFSAITFMPSNVFIVIVWIISLLVLAVGVGKFISSITKQYTIENLFNGICALDKSKPYEFCVVIIRDSSQSGKLLQFYNKRWKCYFFPNYQMSIDSNNLAPAKASICNRICNDTSIRMMPEQVNYIGNDTSTKYSYGDKAEKTYLFHYFLYKGKVPEEKAGKNYYFNGKKYHWMSIESMSTNANMLRKNKDVIEYVRKHITFA